MNNRLHSPSISSEEARLQAHWEYEELRTKLAERISLVLKITNVPLHAYPSALAQATQLTGARGLAGGRQDRVRLLDVKHCCIKIVTELEKLGFQLTDE